ncbi:hypothetical protein LINGRAHAP2_LOCUS24092, partial [Linum grandiflorum]
VKFIDPNPETPRIRKYPGTQENSIPQALVENLVGVCLYAASYIKLEHVQQPTSNSHNCSTCSVKDNLYFKRFCCTLQPHFKVPIRNIVKKDILNLFNDGNMIHKDEAIAAESLE